MLRAMLARYRRAGAELPFCDPARDHGAPFEGYYWRFTDAARGRVTVALCGLSASEDGRWALIALAAHPGGVVRAAMVPSAHGDPLKFGVSAGEVVTASARSVRFLLAPEDALHAEIEESRPWPRRAVGGSGPAQVVPGLPQYWHPYLMGGRARGELSLAGERIALDGASVYAEKNWGSNFPRRWWWGQADAFGGADVCVAFAGGPVRIAGVAMRPTVAAVRLEERLLALAPPFAVTLAEVGQGGWRVRARSGRHKVEIEGEDPADSAVALPVPVAGRREAEPRSHQALAGQLRLVVRRGRRTLFRGESALAGLERESGA